METVFSQYSKFLEVWKLRAPVYRGSWSEHPVHCVVKLGGDLLALTAIRFDDEQSALRIVLDERRVHNARAIGRPAW